MQSLPRSRSRELLDERTAAIYEIGLQNLQLSPGTGALPEKARRFESGLIDLRKQRGVYSENPSGVEISEGVLYRARISIPSQVPVGTYTAETFLIQDGRVLAVATRDIDDRQERVRALGLARRAPARGPLRPRRGHHVAWARLGGRDGLPPPLLRPKANFNRSRLLRLPLGKLTRVRAE